MPKPQAQNITGPIGGEKLICGILPKKYDRLHQQKLGHPSSGQAYQSQVDVVR